MAGYRHGEHAGTAARPVRVARALVHGSELGLLCARVGERAQKIPRMADFQLVHPLRTLYASSLQSICTLTPQGPSHAASQCHLLISKLFIMALSLAGLNVIVLWAIFGCFLCFVAVGLRFYARYLKGVGYSLNDYTALGGLVSRLPLSI
jgi:hypothetical protein